MSNKDFHERFGIRIDEVGVRQKFVARIEVEIFEVIKNEEPSLIEPDFLRRISTILGERWDRYIQKLGYRTDEYISQNFDIAMLYKGDFNRCLQLLELIYDYTNNEYKKFGKDGKHIAAYMDKTIPIILAMSEVDLNLLWKKGKFYPAGAELLDDKLVEDILDWLNDYKDEKKDFDRALKAMMKKDYNEVVSNSYKCIESLVRNMLGNSKTLDNNKELILSTLKLSKEWGAILNGYLAYANEYGKHGSKKRHDVDPNEAEAFLYMTGLVIRLCIRKENR